MTSMTCRLPRLRMLLTGAAIFFTGGTALPAAELHPAHGPIIAREIVSGLNQPVYVAAPPGETRWLFIVQKTGSIRLFDRQDGTMAAGNFLTISPISTNSERGLLGLAFHPSFSENGHFFINFTNAAGDTVIRRYAMSTEPPYTVTPQSARDILTIPQDFANHNAGWLDFSPVDGYLYIPMGDGGSGNDPNNRAQDRNQLLGSILRIDIDADDFPEDPARNYGIPPDNPFIGQDDRPEIWAYGLRNPWRNSFDRETGDLWIADVGQSAREEINFQPASSPGAENYGWRLMEGTLRTQLDPGASTEGLTGPVYEYDFSGGRKAIAGGYVYRGTAMPHLRGHYFFSDYVADFVKSFRYGGSGSVSSSDVIDWTETFGNIAAPVSFGEDGAGELFIVSHAGKVYQITQSPWHLWRNRHFNEEQIRDTEISGPTADPNGSGLPNLLEYALGRSPLAPPQPSPLISDLEEIDRNLHLTISVPKSPEATDVSLIVEAAGSLDPESWSVDETVVITETPTELHVRDQRPVGATELRFLRVRATLDTP